MNLRNIDLNLLVVLAALLEERSATRAATRLHVTQSAVSNALRRLRSLFDDALLVRTPHGFVPTARAELLAPRLHALLAATTELLAPESAQAPRARTFTIACTDAIGVVLLPQLLVQLSQRVPGARLRMLALDYEVQTDGLASGEVDLLIGMPPTPPQGCRGERVYEDPLVCVMRAGHPRARGTLTAAAYAALPHVELALFGRADDRVDRALARVGLRRQIALLVGHFSSIPCAIAGSDCVAALSLRLARAYAQPYALRVFEPPVRLPQLQISQYWHRRAEHDAGLHQLREAVRAAASAAGPTSSATKSPVPTKRARSQRS